MGSHHTGYFNGSANTADAHDTLQTVAGNATWYKLFTAGIECSDKHIADVLLRLFHSFALRWAIAGEFPIYIAGKLVSRPDSITI